MSSLYLGGAVYLKVQRMQRGKEFFPGEETGELAEGGGSGDHRQEAGRTRVKNRTSKRQVKT